MLEVQEEKALTRERKIEDEKDKEYKQDTDSCGAPNRMKNILLHSIGGTGCVFFWRGTWAVFDYFADVDDQLLRTALISLGISVIIPLVVALIWLCLPNEAISLKLRQYILIILFGIESVSFWRGIWYLQDALLFPDDPKLSFGLSIGAGLVMLGIVQSWSSILAPPVFFVSDQDPVLCSTIFQNALAFRNLCNHHNKDENQNLK